MNLKTSYIYFLYLFKALSIWELKMPSAVLVMQLLYLLAECSSHHNEHFFKRHNLFC